MTSALKCPGRLGISEAVSGTERSGWPPAQGKGSGIGEASRRIADVLAGRSLAAILLAEQVADFIGIKRRQKSGMFGFWLVVQFEFIRSIA
jgi:hypothetical protein